MPEFRLPKLHSGQAAIYAERTRRNVVRCGRRWGKTKKLVSIAASAALRGRKVGIFTPEHKQLLEPWDELKEILQPAAERANKSEGAMRLRNGAKLDIWACNDNDLAGRGREYDLVLMDEAAFGKPTMRDIWEKSIEPTMLTTRGSAWVFSTPFGIEPDNFFYACCTDASMGFKEFHAPSISSPYVPHDELEKIRLRLPPLVFKQEYLAEFVDWSGIAFFELDKWMGPDSLPLPYPDKCDAVFATIDTAVKDGKEHDGTGIIYWGISKHGGVPLMILDWDIVQIKGALLETWLPTVYERLEQLATVCGARNGSLGAFIEDKASGTILLQQAELRGWPATAIDSKLTAVGKDERAVSVSGIHYRGECKISVYAYDKLVTFKGLQRNHLMTQVLGFRLGDKEASKRADDLFDCYTYGLSIALGNRDGY